jgi:hypothetical protein
VFESPDKPTNEIEIEHCPHLKEQEFEEYCLLSESPQLLQLCFSFFDLETDNELKERVS